MTNTVVGRKPEDVVERRAVKQAVKMIRGGRSTTEVAAFLEASFVITEMTRQEAKA